MSRVFDSSCARTKAAAKTKAAARTKITPSFRGLVRRRMLTGCWRLEMRGKVHVLPEASGCLCDWGGPLVKKGE